MPSQEELQLTGPRRAGADRPSLSWSAAKPVRPQAAGLSFHSLWLLPGSGRVGLRQRLWNDCLAPLTTSYVGGLSLYSGLVFPGFYGKVGCGTKLPQHLQVGVPASWFFVTQAQLLLLPGAADMTLCSISLRRPSVCLLVPIFPGQRSPSRSI